MRRGKKADHLKQLPRQACLSCVHWVMSLLKMTACLFSDASSICQHHFSRLLISSQSFSLFYPLKHINIQSCAQARGHTYILGTLRKVSVNLTHNALGHLFFAWGSQQLTRDSSLFPGWKYFSFVKRRAYPSSYQMSPLWHLKKWRFESKKKQKARFCFFFCQLWPCS